MKLNEPKSQKLGLQILVVNKAWKAVFWPISVLREGTVDRREGK